MRNEEIYGWAGEILRVDLRTGHTSTGSTLKYARKFLGGRGINWAILYDTIKIGTHAFGSENVLGIGTGVLVGTLAPSACRYTVDTKNPFTGGVGSADGGGHWGAELKFAGYDNIIVEGKAKKPVYLWINEQHVELRDANHFWGKNTWETSELIREELGDPDIQVLCIGPAGENLCMGACVIANNARAAGRCGVGAVFGSKNLKAIVVRGMNSIETANPEKFLEIVDRLLEILLKNEDIQLLLTLGTNGVITESSCLAVRNSQETYWRNFSQKVGGKALRKYEVRKLSCFACPIHCSHWLEVKEGPFAGLKGEGFEANTATDWGARIGVDYLPAIIKLHITCNQLGLDVDVPSVTIAWAMECYQRGILTKEDTGLDLSWGNYESVIELLQSMAYKKGKFASILASGVRRASEIIGRGSEKYAMHVKGQDLFEECRRSVGWALGVATSTRGGTHTRGAVRPIYCVPSRKPEVYEGVGKFVVYTEQLKAITDALGLCLLVSKWYAPSLLGQDEYAELITATTGWKVTGKDLLVIGERIQNVEKAFNVREAGFTRKDDSLPKRYFEPIPSGPMKGFCLNKKKWGKALDEYYREHDWDVKTGLQTRRCLEKLNLKKVANDLKKLGKTS